MLQMTRPAGRPKSDRVPLLGWFSAIRVMFSSRNTAIIIRRVYDTIHMGLWAPLVAFPTSRNRICSPRRFVAAAAIARASRILGIWRSKNTVPATIVLKFPMGEPTLDRRFHRKLETEGLTLKKVLLLVALSLGVACAVGVVDQLQRFGAF